MKRNVGILIFNDAEVLDFAGPFEVFAVSSAIHDHSLFNTFLVSETSAPVKALNGMNILPNYHFKNAPKIDILILSGGRGSRTVSKNDAYLNWVKDCYKNCEYLLSICSGVRILSSLGMLEGKEFCTHQEVYKEIIENVPSSIPQKEKRFTHFDNVYTSGGISAGIDLSFEIVKKLYGEDVFNRTRNYMEYDRK
ncbi:MAG: DJ-1/PfpI family protein [Tannerellaceae bacterium]|jgi:transcriptional regulator GlxA family with amidase domain|nr:DJ-1/PfpI family protein [Tannerellaceae bacterium]